MAAHFTGHASWKVCIGCAVGFRQMQAPNWLLGLVSEPCVVGVWCPSVAGIPSWNPAKALRHSTCRLQASVSLHTIGALGEGSGGIERRFSAVSASRLFLSNEQS